MVESTALEMRRMGNRTVGSNPTLSASRSSYQIFSGLLPMHRTGKGAGPTPQLSPIGAAPGGALPPPPIGYTMTAVHEKDGNAREAVTCRGGHVTF